MPPEGTGPAPRRRPREPVAMMGFVFTVGLSIG